jgi:hypothetical protein
MTTMQAVDPKRGSLKNPAHKTQSARAPLPLGWKLGAGASALGAEGTVVYLNHVLGVALVVIDVLIPVAVALILLAAILRGSKETCERVFRLLRWIANRPEPPEPVPQSELYKEDTTGNIRKT